MRRYRAPVGRVVPMQDQAQRTAPEHALEKPLVDGAVYLRDEGSPGLAKGQSGLIVQRHPVMALLPMLALFAEALVEHRRRWQRLDETSVSVLRQEPLWIDPRIG